MFWPNRNVTNIRKTLAQNFQIRGLAVTSRDQASENLQGSSMLQNV